MNRAATAQLPAGLPAADIDEDDGFSALEAEQDPALS
jgi:hypothetical protein